MDFEKFMNTEFAKNAMEQYATELFLFYKNINKIEELNFNTTTKVYRDCNDKLKTAIDSDRKNATYTFLPEKLVDIPVMENIEILDLPKPKSKFENVDYFLYNNQPKISNIKVIKHNIFKLTKKPFVKISVKKEPEIIINNRPVEAIISYTQEDKTELLNYYFYNLEQFNSFYTIYKKSILTLLEPYEFFDKKILPHRFLADYVELKENLDEDYGNNSYYKFKRNHWFSEIEKNFTFESKKKKKSGIETIINLTKENNIEDNDNSYELCF